MVKIRGGLEGGILHSEWPEDVLLTILIKGLP
jgi:hypothetical protein